MSKQYVMAIDQGTTGSTVMILDQQLRVCGKANEEYAQIYPKPGWVEHEPNAIWNSVRGAMRASLAQADIDTKNIAAIGITNQRETSLFWDRASGRAVHNAIVWQCRRTADICTQMKSDGLEAMYKKRTGLVLDPYFSGTKARWVLENVDGVRDKAEAGDLAFGTIDTYLVWRLTGGKAHVTDVSNASRTLMMDIHDLDWSDELLKPLGVPRAVLPEIRGNAEVYGHTQGDDILPAGIPIAGMAGDQQSALFGQACFAVGEAKCTYGTGAFLLVNTGEEVVNSNNGLLTTVGWRLDGKTTYALEGSVFIAGAAVQWLRDQMGLIESSSEVEALAATVENSGGVIFVPALAGLGAPHWRPEARGLLSGITRGTTRGHMARATLEGVGFMVHELLAAMAEDLGKPISNLKVDGGASANSILMQFQSDLLQAPIVRPQMLETTALGAAFLAGLGVGLWSSIEDIRQSWKRDRVFAPKLSSEEAQCRIAAWDEVVKKA